MCGSRKYPYSHHGGSLEITRRIGGGGVLKAKFFKGKSEPILEFQEGWGSKQKKPSMGGVWIFSGTTQCTRKKKASISYSFRCQECLDWVNNLGLN